MRTLGELAAFLGAELRGDPSLSVTGIAPLGRASASQLSFLASARYLGQLQQTRAAAVILRPDQAERCPVACLLADNPYLAFARATALFVDETPVEAGVHPSATVSAQARLAPGVSVGANVVIDAGADIGPNVVLGANCVIGERCRIGAGTRLHASVVLYRDVTIGEHCTLHANAVLGADGFGFAPSPEGWQKIHQLGGVRIGNRVEIGACTTIDRGALEDTVVEDGAIIDNLVQIAHNCHIGKNTAIAGCTGLAGSTIIGANCTLAGGVGVVGHVEICDNVHITGMTMVTKSITEPGSYSSGTPMASTRDWKRSAVRFAQLDSIQKRLAGLEKQQQE
ncbi:MAG: UDP-3-O-(3-hydroxymyristoyl)glucosamine N-acyltransferase [Haliea sp.]|uniref:UDP-3-O-(3-hydroxymyristoyl)glucosamine N-acyltransferase n=1 Tax=Haliea sp. TaxID=1932666 RepID=UPI000C4C8CCE|nr:UDP-3-O-(3-hydroxymyristoyl)glucosamine N-acyltransferase [Haliea sp.]MBM70231.1 UDP-3-O-(3-hydroxymyristoyl)glucosamine N-acyltransferase [Haliea sp.]|tara:strand:+ start:31060 stop:32073 length:1014 start_codon:yes stop_codon:yes gene_type:complete